MATSFEVMTSLGARGDAHDHLEEASDELIERNSRVYEKVS